MAKDTKDSKLDKDEHLKMKHWRNTTGRDGSKQKRGGQKGNLNALKHGIFATRFLTEEEKPVFDSIIEKLYLDFEFNKSSDFMQVELVAVYYLKLGRAQEADDLAKAEILDRMIRAHMRDLRTTKIAREGEGGPTEKVSPADWASGLMEKLTVIADGKADAKEKAPATKTDPAVKKAPAAKEKSVPAVKNKKTEK